MRYAADGLIVAGAALAATGLWWIYPPVALIAGGAALVALGYLASGPKAGA